MTVWMQFPPVPHFGDKMHTYSKVYKGYKILGPWTRYDGRKHSILFKSRKDKKTISYPKLLVEEALGEKLKRNETIDHIDGNFKNDSFDNLRIVKRRDHSVKDSLRRPILKECCLMCNKHMTLTRSQISSRQQGKAGPFCSKSCAGRYGAEISNGKGFKKPVNPIIYTLSKNKNSFGPFKTVADILKERIRT